MGDDVWQWECCSVSLGDALEVKGLNNLCELMSVCQLLTNARSRVSGLCTVQFVSPVMVLVCRT